MSREISEQKRVIRERVRALRQSLAPDEVHEAGVEVCRLARSRVLDAGLRRVCVYASTGKEIPTEELMELLLADGVDVSVPDWEAWKQGSGLRIVSIRSTGELAREGRVVPQPAVTGGRSVPVDEIELFLVPGIAFDRLGTRLGMGGGYFDRLLSRASSKATLTGLAYDFQVLTHLPSEEHDVPVHGIVTPGGYLEGELNHRQEGKGNGR